MVSFIRPINVDLIIKTMLLFQNMPFSIFSDIVKGSSYLRDYESMLKFSNP